MPELKPRHAELAEACGLFTDPAAAALRTNPLQQLWREHLLAQSMIDYGLYDEGYLVTIAPALNYHVQDAAEAYHAHLREPEDGKVRFVNVTLPVGSQLLEVAKSIARQYVPHAIDNITIKLPPPQRPVSVPYSFDLQRIIRQFVPDVMFNSMCPLQWSGPRSIDPDYIYPFPIRGTQYPVATMAIQYPDPTRLVQYP